MAIPSGVISAGALAYDLHDPTIPVARICFDSLLDLSPHGSCRARRLIFEDASLLIEVLTGAGPTGRDLEVSWTPPSPGDLVVLHQHRSTRIAASGVDGLAVVPDFRSELTSLLLRREVAGGGPVRTAWVLL